MSVIASAKTIGQTVGSGISTLSDLPGSRGSEEPSIEIVMSSVSCLGL
jgi:hypothetical protein